MCWAIAARPDGKDFAMLDIVKELEKTLHIHSHELPFVEAGFGTSHRILMARPVEGLFAIHLRAEPFAKSGLHKHHNHVMGYTIAGAWGHDDQGLYRPGTFIYETPGVIHQFVNGPEVSEAIFIGDPALDFVDPETLEVISSYNGRQMLDGYIAKCNDLGITPRFLQ